MLPYFVTKKYFVRSGGETDAHTAGEAASADLSLRESGE